MATYFEFDVKIDVWRLEKGDGRYFASSQQLPIYADGETEQELHERVDDAVALWCSYMGKAYTRERIEAYLDKRGITPTKRTEDTPRDIQTLNANPVLVMAGDR